MLVDPKPQNFKYINSNTTYALTNIKQKKTKKP